MDKRRFPNWWSGIPKNDDQIKSGFRRESARSEVANETLAARGLTIPLKFFWWSGHGGSEGSLQLLNLVFSKVLIFRGKGPMSGVGGAAGGAK